MRILVTAFDPFGGDETNSSLIVLNALNDKIGDIEIDKLMLPTVYGKCAKLAWEKAMEQGDCAIVSLGQAGGRNGISIEAIGINYASASLGDNEGKVIEGEKLFSNGENAYFSTLPVKEIVTALKKRDMDAYISASAGGFVCNSLLYTLLKKADENNLSIPIGFVHLPYEASQRKESFSLKAEDMAAAIEEIITVTGKYIESERIEK